MARATTVVPARGGERSGWAPMNVDRARALAMALHRGQRDASGALLIDHIRRVAGAVPPEARVVAWLHEVLERTAIPEEALLADGLSSAELRAIRLLTRHIGSRSSAGYLAHVDLITRAGGDGGRMARAVKRADLADRIAHRPGEPGGWSPPYELALGMLGGS